MSTNTKQILYSTITTPYLVVVLVVLAFVALADAIAAPTPMLQTFDRSFLNAIYRWDLPVLNVCMIVLTYLGNDPPLFLIAFIIGIWFIKHGHKSDAWLLWGSAVTARILGIILKFVVELPRPMIKLPPEPLEQYYGYGYPSGHALMSMAILGLSGMMISRCIHRSSFKLLVRGFGALLILGIGFSRIYLGYHWINDVIGGYLYGAVIALTSYIWTVAVNKGGQTRESAAAQEMGRLRRSLGTDSDAKPRKSSFLSS